MDREIPKEVRQKGHNKKIIRYSSVGVAGIIAISVLISVLRAGVGTKNLVFSTIDGGVIEVSISASGKIVPALEEIINSPIDSRTIEIYKKGGDGVDIDTPVLRLDLQSTKIEYRELLGEEQMRQCKLDQLRINNQTKLSDVAMQTKVSVMKLSRTKVELRNGHYLDNLGAGATDRVRQAELNYNVAQLEYEQLQQQYKNGKGVTAAELKVQKLDFNIFRKSLSEKKRALDDAQIRSPRKTTLTCINSQIGAQISEGGRVAIISDLSHFRVEGEIAGTYGDHVVAGGKAIVKIESGKLEGIVSSVTPLSKNDVISFTVQLKEDNHRRLRSGLKTDIYVVNVVKEGIMRMANGFFYVGHGEYGLLAYNSDDELIRHKIQLGDSSFEYVEVLSGLQLGDEVVVSDISAYKNKNRLKIK